MTEIANDEHVAFTQFANEIDAYYRERFRYKSRYAHARHPTVDIGRSAVRLYLRFRVGDSWPVGSVVIAAIEFQSRRRGHGTALLSKLVEMSPTYGYQNIEIEQTGKDASIQAFVRKFGFTNSFDKQNWIIPVDRLRGLLATQRPRPEITQSTDLFSDLADSCRSLDSGRSGVPGTEGIAGRRRGKSLGASCPAWGRLQPENRQTKGMCHRLAPAAGKVEQYCQNAESAR